MVKRLIADFSRRKSGFDSAPLHVRFVVNIEAVGLVCVCIIPPMHHTHLHLHAALTRSRTYKKQSCFENRGRWKKGTSTFYRLKN